MFKIILFRMWLRKHQRENPQFREVLKNEELFDAVFYGYIDTYPEVGPQNLQSFLDWLMENKEDIIEFIKLLIDLFS